MASKVAENTSLFNPYIEVPVRHDLGWKAGGPGADLVGWRAEGSRAWKLGWTAGRLEGWKAAGVRKAS